MKTSITILRMLLISAYCLVSCKQNPAAQKDTPADYSTDFKIADSMEAGTVLHLYITNGKTNFYDLPDSQRMRKEFVPTNQGVNVLDIKNGFAYAAYNFDSSKNMIGWLPLSNLKQILFTPPKIVADEEEPKKKKKRKH